MTNGFPSRALPHSASSPRLLSAVCCCFCALFGFGSALAAPPVASAENKESAAADVPSFRADIMPIFFRAGCNAGTCHGSARGKDGFMLSLFGYDPKGDYERIVTEMIGRRVNTSVPERSLLLLKATGDVDHTGGELFTRDSVHYRTLLRWIAAGAPDDADKVPEVVELKLSADRFVFKSPGANDRLRVTARMSDGSSRDVTELAKFFSNNDAVAKIDADGRVVAAAQGDSNVFARFSRFTQGAEVIVLPNDANFVWPNPPINNYIDELVFDRLQKLSIAPSDLCDDETFLRRVSLDLIARPPTPQEYRDFMADTRSDKRAHKIDVLIASDDFADYWTSMWAEQFRIKGGGYGPDKTFIKAADAFYEWIRKQMRSGRPLNEFVADMVTASGSNLTNGPVNLYTMMVHKPRLNPKEFAADFSQVFLGVQIQCAECHNHPFDRWTMTDYYGFTSFFTGIVRKPGTEPRDARIYFDVKAPPAKHLVDSRPVPAKILGHVESVPGDGDPRKALAAWLTAPENELFSRNLANRIWAHYLGRGIVEPVDDVRASNPPVNAPLLAALSQHLVQSNFNLRSFVRDICNSRVYQLSTKPNASNLLDTRQFSHSHLRRLRADVLFDSFAAVSGVKTQLPFFPEGTRAIDFYPRGEGATEGPQFGYQFFETFGRSDRNTICACATKREPTLSQTLHLIVGDTVRQRVAAGGTLQKLISTESAPEPIIEELFVRALSRRPTTKEMAAMRELVGDRVKDVAVYEDIFWSLMNSTEFSFNY
ncbi:MAG: DUF1549 and DUF1553 domain-containing protein [Planctomycetia bacterium]|nr:DUF1549 and DUF1553 domain-containing protein [Planctomycetia bacterium]